MNTYSKQKKQEKTKNKNNKNNWWVLAMLILAGGFYLYSINETAIQGYKIRDNEKEIAKLKKENEALQIEKAELTSLYRIEEIQTKNMEKINQVVYLEESESIAYNKQ